MLPRLSLALAAFAFIGSWQVAEASPLTYDFSGTFVGGPGAVMTGPFSGSFTINSDASLGPGGVITETGSDVSITLGNFLFQNNSQNPDTSASLTVSEQPNAPQPVAADLEGSIHSIGLNLSMLFYNPGSVSQYLNLGNYDFSPSTFGSLAVSFQEGGTVTSMNYGTITSIDFVSTPEPQTAVTFVFLLGTAALLRRFRRAATTAQT